MTFRQRVQNLYEGDSERSDRFRYGLLAFDALTVLFIVVSSFFHGHALVETLDFVFGFLILVDFLARLWIGGWRLRDLLTFQGIADVIVVLSLLAPMMGEKFAFLRVVRALRLLRSYRLIRQLREDFPYFQKNEDVILALANLIVFLFVMTALVFETQVGRHGDIRNYVDAFYFTITALTTTGFGDITLEGTGGRALSIIIMIFGVSLFIRLIQTIFRPTKVRHSCPRCGLFLHDIDAIHCKHCGLILNIPNEGIL